MAPFDLLERRNTILNFLLVWSESSLKSTSTRQIQIKFRSWRMSEFRFAQPISIAINEHLTLLIRSLKYYLHCFIMFVCCYVTVRRGDWSITCYTSLRTCLGENSRPAKALDSDVKLELLFWWISLLDILRAFDEMNVSIIFPHKWFECLFLYAFKVLKEFGSAFF